MTNPMRIHVDPTGRIGGDDVITIRVPHKTTASLGDILSTLAIATEGLEIEQVSVSVTGIGAGLVDYLKPSIGDYVTLVEVSNLSAWAAADYYLPDAVSLGAKLVSEPNA